MSSRSRSLLLALAGVWLVSGCATGRDYQADIDALNSKVAALQGRLSAKDQEISQLQSQVGDTEAARIQAENDKRLLSERLDRTLSKIDALSRKPASSSAADSDLK